MKREEKLKREAASIINDINSQPTQELKDKVKKQYKEMLDAGTEAKYKACRRKDGSFDYIKMSQMFHSGNW